MRTRLNRRLLGVVLLATTLGACGQDLYVGSDLLWIARHETRDFSEWTNGKEGRAVSGSSPNVLEITSEQVHTGKYGARLSIYAPSGATGNTSASLIRDTNLPAEAYYSAWYYVPQAITVGTFWVLMKFRKRESANDASSDKELLDLDLKSNSNGTMSFHLFDHRRGGDYPLDQGAKPEAPIGKWFQIEVYYHNTQDTMARATYWLDGHLLLDLKDEMLSPTPWVEWDVGSVGQDLTPSTAVLFIDDAAISNSRVGPTGALTR